MPVCMRASERLHPQLSEARERGRILLFVTVGISVMSSPLRSPSVPSDVNYSNRIKQHLAQYKEGVLRIAESGVWYNHLDLRHAHTSCRLTSSGSTFFPQFDRASGNGGMTGRYCAE